MGLDLYRKMYRIKGMVMLHDRHQMSVSDATRRGVSGLLADAESGQDIIVARHAKPVAAVVSMQRFGELQALTRVATDTGRRTSLDDALAAFGTTRAELEDLDDDDE
jgi:prevent-host-death family protein